jgi:hypothetical protein
MKRSRQPDSEPTAFLTRGSHCMRHTHQTSNRTMAGGSPRVYTPEPTHTAVMRARWKVSAPSLVTALTLAACASSGTANGRAYEQFRVSCCTDASLQTDWHPGGAVTLHWIVASDGTTTDPAAAPITLTAAISGPFASVAALKAAGSDPETLTAAPLHLSARNPGDPVSTIALPTTLAAGWYNLVYSVNSGSGNSVGGASVIRVTAV